MHVPCINSQQQKATNASPECRLASVARISWRSWVTPAPTCLSCIRPYSSAGHPLGVVAHRTVDGAGAGLITNSAKVMLVRIEQASIRLLIPYVYHRTLSEYTSLERNEKNDDLTARMHASFRALAPQENLLYPSEYILYISTRGQIRRRRAKQIALAPRPNFVPHQFERDCRLRLKPPQDLRAYEEE